MLTNWCFLDLINFNVHFLSTCFLALFQQFVDDAGSLDNKKQDLKVAQSAEVDSAAVPLQDHQFELPMDAKNDLETFSMPVSPHDRVVMHKARGVMLREPLVERFCDLDMFRNFVKNSNPLCDVALGM